MEIMQLFDDIPDDRDPKKVTYPLSSLLFMSICSIFCGAESWDDMAYWVDCREEWLAQYIDMSQGTPCYSTFRRLFKMIKPEAFSNIMQSIIDLHNPNKVAEDQIAIDGKTLRGTKCLSKGVKAIQMVSALSITCGRILAEVSTNSKSNEITAIPLLLDLLKLQDTTITADAMACNEKIIGQIVQSGGHYVIGLKKNQPKLYDAVKAYAAEIGTQTEHLMKDYFDDTHGRQVRRRYFSFEIPESIQALGFTNMKTVVATETISSNNHNDKETTAQWRYYITDHDAKNSKLPGYIRDHWQIESTHWLLDVHLSDDKDKKYEENAAENFAKIKRLLLNLVKGIAPKSKRKKKRSIRGRLKHVGWDLDYLAQLLFS